MPALRYTQVNWNTIQEFYESTTKGQGYLGGQLSDRRYKLYRKLSEELENHYRKEAARYNNRYHSLYTRNPLGLGVPTEWIDFSRGYSRSNYGQVMGSGAFQWDLDKLKMPQSNRNIGSNGEVATLDLSVAMNPRMGRRYSNPSPQDFAVAFTKITGDSLNRALAGLGNQDCYDVLVSLMTDGQCGRLYELDDSDENKPVEIVQTSLFDDNMNSRVPIDRVIMHLASINRLTQLKFLRKFYQNNPFSDGADLWDGDRKGLKVVLHGEKTPAYLDYGHSLPMPSIHMNTSTGVAENAEYYRDDFMYDLNPVSFWVGYYFAHTGKVADMLEDSINNLINEHWDALKNIYNKELNLSNKTTQARIRKSALAKLALITNLDENTKRRIVAQAIQMDNPYTMLSVLGMSQQEAELIQLNFKDLSKLVGKKFCEEIRDNLAEGQEAQVNRTQAQLDGEITELNRLRKIKF